MYNMTSAGKKTRGDGENRSLNTNTPAVDSLCGIMTSAMYMPVIQTAHELRIFDKLRETGACSVEKLSQQFSFHNDSLERLLNTLCAMGLLHYTTTRNETKYKNSEQGDLLATTHPNTLKELISWTNVFQEGLKELATMVREGPGSMEGFQGQDMKNIEGMEECHHGHYHDGEKNVYDASGKLVHGPGKREEMGKEKVEQLKEVTDKCHHGNLHDKDGNVYNSEGALIHGPGEVKEKEKEDKSDKDDKDAEDGHDDEDWLEFYIGMNNILEPRAKELLTAVDLSSYKSAVDLGGGSGAACFELRRQYTDMKVTYFELESIVKMFKEHFLPGKEDLKVDIIEGDWNKTELPKSDLYVISQVLHDITDPEDLLQKVYNAIKPGGAILILEQLLADDKVSVVDVAIWDIVMMTHGGRLRSPAEYRKLLKSTGFDDITVIRTQEHNEYDIIHAVKPGHSDNKKPKKK